MRIWKWVGLAGVVSVALVGVAAGTSFAARGHRPFVDVEPDELARRLADRLEAARRRESERAGDAD